MLLNRLCCAPLDDGKADYVEQKLHLEKTLFKFGCLDGLGQQSSDRAIQQQPGNATPWFRVARPQAPQRVRYTTLHKHLISQMAFTSQDLLVLFGSFGMALFALNIYKITAAQG